MPYQLYLEEQNKLYDKSKKRKAGEDKIREVQCKQKLLNKIIQAISLEADKSSTEAEVKHKFTLLAKSNTFRLKICESEENAKKFFDQICVLKKNMPERRNSTECLFIKYYVFFIKYNFFQCLLRVPL